MLAKLLSKAAAPAQSATDTVRTQLAAVEAKIATLEQDIRRASLDAILAGEDSAEAKYAFTVANDLKNAQARKETLILALDEADRQDRVKLAEIAAREKKAREKAFNSHAAQYRGHVRDIERGLEQAAAAFQRAIKSSRAINALVPWTHKEHALLTEMIGDRELQGLILYEMRRVAANDEVQFLQPTINTRLTEIEHDWGKTPTLAEITNRKVEIMKLQFAGTAPLPVDARAAGDEVGATGGIVSPAAVAHEKPPAADAAEDRLHLPEGHPDIISLRGHGPPSEPDADVVEAEPPVVEPMTPAEAAANAVEAKWQSETPAYPPGAEPPPAVDTLAALLR